MNDPKGSEEASVQSKVGIVFGDVWLRQCDRLPKFELRTSMVLSLIKSYGLMSRLEVLPARAATFEELNSFHSSDFLNHLRVTTDSSDRETGDQNFGLEYDCPVLSDMFNLISWVSGGSITAAESIVNGICRLAINWAGGWHHAQRDEASGFCYVNDIVIAIQLLRKKFDRVLYIDLDVHHGDGVENAFAFSPNVFTFSIHKFEQGYFPGTGSLQDIGFGNGKHFSLNIPLKDGINDEQYFKIFQSLFVEILFAFKPNAVVVQCGADSLAFDPLGGFNLSIEGLGLCVQRILKADLPTLFLGGGGYNAANASRCWTYLTWIILSSADPSIAPLADDIPDSDTFFTRYGPSFELKIKPGLRRNENVKQDLDDILEEAFESLDEVS